MLSLTDSRLISSLKYNPVWTRDVDAYAEFGKENMSIGFGECAAVFRQTPGANV